MADIFDYIAWRGDLTFNQAPLNCVDALIFSQMAYFPFDGLWTEEENGTVTLAEAQKRLCQQMEKGANPYFHMAKDRELFPAMAQSRRFGGLKLRDFVNSIDLEQEKQFAAITVLLPEGAFLVYRGTDNTLVGWNEDLNMSFTTPVPAQMDAVAYFEQAAVKLEGPLWMGGHSFVPQSSIVGMLFDHVEDYVVVHSRQIGPLQHDLYSWSVLGPDFVRLSGVNNSSRIWDKTLKEWLARVEPAQKEEFVDAIFNILGSTNANSFHELGRDILKNSSIILKYVKHLDPETKKMVIETLSMLRHSAQDQVPEFLPKVPWKQNT